MLRGIHKASANWLGRAIMGVVLGLIAVSFGIWGIGDIFRGFGTTTVAKVGGQEIRVEQYRQMYQERLQQLGRNLGRPIMPDQARAIGLDRQVLQQMIAERALDERVAELRLNLSDADVGRQITDSATFKGINGQFDRSRFDALLRNMGFSEARFVDEQKRSALRQQLIGAVSGAPPLPKTVTDAFNRFENEERSIEYVTLGAAQAGDIPPPTPEELSKYFEERKVVFRAPEFRTITIVPMTAEDLAATIEVSDADLKKAYESRRSRFETPERRHVKQIVFPNAGDARTAADKLAKGETFEALAAERDLKESDIDLGTVAKNAIVDRAVADAAFGLKADEVSPPIEGRFGIAIVKVLSIEPATTKPFEEVVDQVKGEVALERAKNELSNVQEKIEDERLGGSTLADAARKFKLKPREIEVDRTGKTPDGKQITDLPQGTDVLAAAFAAEVHGENEALRLPGNGYVWFDVSEIKPSRERPLDEVKDQVLARWKDDKVAAKLKVKATEMIDKIKGGAAFNEVAAADNLKIEWRPGIKRSATPPGFPASAVNEVFRTPKDAASSVDAGPADRIVFRVTEIKVPPLDPQSADAKRLDEGLRQRIADDLLQQYLARVQDDVGVTINQSAVQQAVGGGNAN